MELVNLAEQVDWDQQTFKTEFLIVSNRKFYIHVWKI